MEGGGGVKIPRIMPIATRKLKSNHREKGLFSGNHSDNQKTLLRKSALC